MHILLLQITLRYKNALKLQMRVKNTATVTMQDAILSHATLKSGKTTKTRNCVWQLQTNSYVLFILNTNSTEAVYLFKKTKISYF